MGAPQKSTPTSPAGGVAPTSGSSGSSGSTGDNTTSGSNADADTESGGSTNADTTGSFPVPPSRSSSAAPVSTASNEAPASPAVDAPVQGGTDARRGVAPSAAAVAGAERGRPAVVSTSPAADGRVDSSPMPSARGRLPPQTTRAGLPLRRRRRDPGQQKRRGQLGLPDQRYQRPAAGRPGASGPAQRRGVRRRRPRLRGGDGGRGRLFAGQPERAGHQRRREELATDVHQ